MDRTLFLNNKQWRKELRKHAAVCGFSYCPVGEQRPDFVKWARYFRQIRESEGFDIVDYPGRCDAVTYVPQSDVEHDEYFIEMATLSLRCSDVGKGYELHKVVSVNSKVDYGTSHYITFEAKKPEAADDVKTFQALVNDAMTRSVKFCRLKEARLSNKSKANA